MNRYIIALITRFIEDEDGRITNPNTITFSVIDNSTQQLLGEFPTHEQAQDLINQLTGEQQ
jgi:hypothetical protein